MDEEKNYKELTEDDFNDDDFFNNSDETEDLENQNKENNNDFSDDNLEDYNKSENKEDKDKDTVKETKEDEDDEKDILKAEESKKSNPEENKASFLNRNMLFVSVGSIFIIFMFFCVFILPNITKRKSAENNELDKAGKVFIPDEYEEDELTDDENSEKPDFKDGNSYLDSLDSEKTSIPGLDSMGTAPVEVPTKMGPVQSTGGSSTSSNYPQNTNRNELQKAMQHIPFEPYSQNNSLVNSSTSANNSASSAQNAYSNYMASKYGSGSYTPTALQSNLSSYLAMQNGSNYERQNNQSGKEQFMNKNAGNGGNYQWNSEFSLWKGTVIPAVLDTGINTDLPGSLKATVTTNIYSSNNGKYILIPQGSVLTGEYNSTISYGQARVQIVWNTLIRPDGLEVNLGSMNGIDAYGFSGAKGHRTEHPFEYLKAMGLIAMFSILDTKAANTIDSQGNTYAQNALSDAYSAGQKLNEKIVDRALDIQPTIKIKSGTEIKLITNLTMDLPPIEPYKVEQKYVRN